MKSSVGGDTVRNGSWSNAPRGWCAVQLRAVAALTACTLLSACAMPEVLALEHEVYEVEGGVETLVDSGCSELPDAPGAGFGFGFGTAPGGSVVPYFVSYEFQSDLVRVSAGAAGLPATEAEYDEAFLRAGGEDELVVELADGFALRLLNRAVDGCDVSAGASGPGLAIE